MPLLQKRLIPIVIALTAVAVGIAVIGNDPPEKLRADFESSFENWISSVGVSEKCGLPTFSDEEIATVTNRAAQAMYPGLRNIFQRGKYQGTLDSHIPIAKLSRTGGYIVSDCKDAVAAATFARWPVDHAIEAAEQLN